MTQDPVDQVIQAYLDHLEEGTPEPSLDHLTSDERQLAEDLIASLLAGRGINPYQSRPSFSSLIADTEFEAAVPPPVNVGLTLDAIRGDVVSALGAASEPIADGAATSEGIRSDAVIRHGSLRIRVQLRDDISTAVQLQQIDPRTAGGPVFGRFPETPAVVIVIGDDELSSVPIFPYDTDDFIGAPDGETHPPRVTRPVLPLVDTLRLLVADLAPDLTVDDLDSAIAPIELTEIIDTECASASAAIVEEGRKARTDAKKEMWLAFDEVAFLTAMTEAAAADALTGTDLDEAITSTAAA